MRVRRSSRFFLTVIAIVVILCTVFPLIWMGISSFKTEAEIQRFPIQVFPDEWRLDNYEELFEGGAFLRALMMTMLGASIFSLGGIAINSMAAFAFARIDFRYRNFFWVYVIVTMFIPFMSIFVTSFIVVHGLGMVNTLSVLIVPALAAAVNVFFFRQFFLFFPLSLEEAAIIDGCSRFGVFVRIFLPNSIAIIVIVGIQRFMGYWNSYVWAVMTIRRQSLHTVMQALSYFRTQYGNDWGIIMAGSATAAILPLVLLIAFQRYIIQGVKISGMK